MADVHFASANMQKAQTGYDGKGFCFSWEEWRVLSQRIANLRRDCSTMRKQVLHPPARLLTVSDSDTKQPTATLRLESS